MAKLNHKVPHLDVRLLRVAWRRSLGVFGVSPVFHRLDAEGDK